ncbi:hypothetical protein RMATCC62417_11845 [Rhizopus microsporus]|nr:hypothetical protein RMATCC62417_11845 [Rhizopus microsporus]
MGIQDVVARLNKSAGFEDTTITKPKFNTNKTVMINKAFPPSPATSPTSSTQSEQKELIKPKEIKVERKESIQKEIKLTKPEKKELIIPTVDMDKVDSISAEIVELYQQLLDQYNASQEYITTLEREATKVRDYEIRVEYLANKLEQVSEERDYFEQQLKQHMPPSPAISQKEVVQDQQKNDAFMADLIHVYEDIIDEEDNEEGDELIIFDDNNNNNDYIMNLENEIQKGIQLTIAKYVNDLEQQRQETKQLKQVIQKQDELITTLENKLQNQSLLKEQVELQTIELENKRELLSQLLNGRDDLLKKKRSSSTLSTSSSSQGHSNRHSSLSSGRRTPTPLTAPPKQPLPPLPSC